MLLHTMEQEFADSINEECFVQFGLTDNTQVWFAVPTGAIAPVAPITASYSPFKYTIDVYHQQGDSSGILIRDMRADPKYADHPMTKNRPHIRCMAVLPLLSAFHSHCIGIISLSFYQPWGPFTDAQKKRFQLLSSAGASAFQECVMDAVRRVGEDGQPPTVWINTKTSNWDVLEGNNAWVELTGLDVDVMKLAGGFLRVLSPGTDSEKDALLDKIRERNSTKEEPFPLHASIPSIMVPVDPTGASLQLVLALHPADGDGIWAVEVHARTCSDPATIRSSGSSFRANSLSVASPTPTSTTVPTAPDAFAVPSTPPPYNYAHRQSTDLNQSMAQQQGLLAASGSNASSCFVDWNSNAFDVHTSGSDDAAAAAAAAAAASLGGGIGIGSGVGGGSSSSGTASGTSGPLVGPGLDPPPTFRPCPCANISGPGPTARSLEGSWERCPWPPKSCKSPKKNLT